MASYNEFTAVNYMGKPRDSKGEVKSLLPYSLQQQWHGEMELKRNLVFILISIILISCSGIHVMGDPVLADVTDKDGSTVIGGVYGDVVRVVGTGVIAGSQINLYWDAVKSWKDGEGLLNSSEGLPNGSFEVWFLVPDSDWGTHYLWVKDVEESKTDGPALFSISSKLIITPGSGLPRDKITLKGYGFKGDADVTDITFDSSGLSTTPSTPRTNPTGSWEATFKVPSLADNEYTITTEDEGGKSASETFKIGPAITIDNDEGSVGSTVEVYGRGFTENGIVESVTLNGILCGVLDDDDLEIENDGEFRFDFVVPSVNQVDRDFEIIVTDDDSKEATVYFRVTELSEISLDPEFGPQGSSVSITGNKFAPSSDVEISIDGSTVKTLRTNSNGHFDGTFRIPAISMGTYTVTAEQGAYNIDESQSFRIGTMIVILSSSSGPCGKKVTLSGTGFTPNGHWNASIDGVSLFEDETVSGDAYLFGTFYVPTLDPGTYTVTITDIDEGIMVKNQFMVTQRTSVTLEPSIFPAGSNVTLKGSYFAESDGDIDVDFTYYNDTDEWDMDVYKGTSTVSTGDDGDFLSWWDVPEDLEEGKYTVIVTDDEGLYAEFNFTIGEKIISISTRREIFSGGNTIGFYVESSFKEEGSYIAIRNPSGVLTWQTDDLNTWIKDGIIYTAPYYTQTAGGHPMVLESDAVEGNWTWIWYDSEDKELASGSFQVGDTSQQEEEEEEPVVEEPDVQNVTLQNKIDSLEAELNQYQTELEAIASSIEGMSSSTSGAIVDVAEEVSSLRADINDMAGSIEEVRQLAANAETEVESLREEAASILSAARTQTYIVYAALIISIVSFIMGFVGPLQITRKRPV
jgi:hypothetical protein